MWDCSLAPEARPVSEGNHPDLVVTVKKMKQIYIIEMACPSWRYRAHREELKTIKYNLERHPDFKVDQTNINIDGILAGECCMYVCMFVCLFVCVFGCGSARKLEFPRGFAAPENLSRFHRLLRVAATQLPLW